jgi:hypothetical protein
VLIDDTTEGDITSRLASFVKRAASERTKHQQEISRLEEAKKESLNSRHFGNAELLRAENEEAGFPRLLNVVLADCSVVEGTDH